MTELLTQSPATSVAPCFVSGEESDGSMTTGEMTAAQAAAGQPEIEERKAPPAAVVIFGASGDLTARKLGPAVENLARYKRIPTEFAVLGWPGPRWTPPTSDPGEAAEAW